MPFFLTGLFEGFAKLISENFEDIAKPLGGTRALASIPRRRRCRTHGATAGEAPPPTCADSHPKLHSVVKSFWRVGLGCLAIRFRSAVFRLLKCVSANRRFSRIHRRDRLQFGRQSATIPPFSDLTIANNMNFWPIWLPSRLWFPRQDRRLTCSKITLAQTNARTGTSCGWSTARQDSTVLPDISLVKI